MRKKIYVASSWRNRTQPWVVSALRAFGHEVYDFRNPAPGNVGFGWKVCTDESPPWSGETLREVLNHPVAVEGYGYDVGALRACDACVLVLPCGRSAHWELGYAMGQGKAGYVVMFEPDEPELMYREARIIADGPDFFEAFAPGERCQARSSTGAACMLPTDHPWYTMEERHRFMTAEKS
jgi:hypothetical protein